jgi:hypothetical protein
MGKSKKALPVAASKTSRRCGLCGKTGRLTRAECCDNWLCDDEDNYVMFSYARNSCHRNHRRFTLCGFHHTEDHRGSWKDCTACRGAFKTEMYVYYGTNEYNFEKLANPPSYPPTHCEKCKAIINLGEDGYSQRGEQYWCQRCSEEVMRRPRADSRGLVPDPTLQQAVERGPGLSADGRAPEDQRPSDEVSERAFTPAAAKRWAAIKGPLRVRLLNNVWCARCAREVSIADYSGRIARNNLIIEGACVRCSGPVARVVEGPS